MLLVVPPTCALAPLALRPLSSVVLCSETEMRGYRAFKGGGSSAMLGCVLSNYLIVSVTRLPITQHSGLNAPA